jgi:hypothetical protein
MSIFRDPDRPHSLGHDGSSYPPPPSFFTRAPSAFLMVRLLYPTAVRIILPANTKGKARYQTATDMSSARRPLLSPRSSRVEQTIVNPLTGRRIRVGGSAMQKALRDGGRAMLKAARDAGLTPEMMAELKAKVAARNQGLQRHAISALEHQRAAKAKVGHVVPHVPRPAAHSGHRASIHPSYYRTHSGYTRAASWHQASSHPRHTVRHIYHHLRPRLLLRRPSYYYGHPLYHRYGRAYSRSRTPSRSRTKKSNKAKAKSKAQSKSKAKKRSPSPRVRSQSFLF